MNLYDRILDLCEEWGISVRSLEKSCGMSHGVIRRWNTRKPSAERVQKVADFFGVSTLYLLGESDEREAKYYIDPEVSRIAQAVKDNPDLKILFDASKKLSKEDILFVLDMIERMK